MSLRLSFRSCRRSAGLTREELDDEFDSRDTRSVSDFSDKPVLVPNELADTAEVGSVSSSLDSSCRSKRSLIQPCGPSVDLRDSDVRVVCGLVDSIAADETGGVNGGST